MNPKSIKVGIMTYENFKKYTKAISPEHLKHSKNTELLYVFTG